jgi:1-acyl-sn-glycerol-3-phosphate acyltransferase
MTKKKYSAINLFIRSLLFFIYSAVSIALYSFLCLIGYLFPLRYRHALIRAYLRSYIYLLKKVCYIDYQVTGLEHIPKKQAVIILSKHQSTWETFFLPTIFHDPAIILKRELLWIPFFGWGLASSDPIAIDRNQKSSAMQQIITKGRRCLQQGRPILIFPEGARIPFGKVGKYRLGGARLAETTGYPVIPVAHNAGLCWPKGKLIKRPGLVQVVIGPIIQSKGKSAEDIMKETQSWIETTIAGMN